MPTYDLVLKGGTIIDGQRTPRYTGDIGIASGKVAQIGSIEPSEASRVIDARDRIVCPGFIDLHTHFDSQIFWDPWCTIDGWHGITSVAIGNCGFGFAPCKPEDRMRSMRTMERNEAIRAETMEAGMPWDWETFPEFLDSIDRTPKGVNVLSYVGINPIMAYVMGIEAGKSRSATADEQKEMARIFREGLAAGACGFSAQLLGPDSPQRDYDGTPMITDCMSHDDLMLFARVLAEQGRGFIQVIGADRELTEELASVSGRPVIWNVLSVGTDQHGINHGEFRDTIKWLDEANARGNRIFGHAFIVKDRFEFALNEWNLFDNFPAWRAVTIGTVAERIEKMQNPELRQAIRDEYEPDSRITGAVMGSLENFTVGSVFCKENQQYEGLQIKEIAAKEGKHPVDVFIDVSINDNLETIMFSPPITPNFPAIKEVMNSNFALPGISDGGAHMKFMTMGGYATEFLSLHVRDNECMELEQAHWRLSAYPALAAGFNDRGWIRKGAPADIVVYDYDRLGLRETERLYDFPAGDWRLAQKADGYDYTIVNGEITFEDSECTGETSGRLLRHGSSGV